MNQRHTKLCIPSSDGSFTITIHFFISGSKVLYGPWLTHAGGFIIYLESVGLLWTKNDQPVAKASTYTGQHNAERRGQTPMLYAAFEPAISVSKRSRLSPQSAQPLTVSAKPNVK
jgi:hypothetical protein